MKTASKPLLAALAMVGVLVAGLFLSTTSANAAYPGGKPAEVAVSPASTTCGKSITVSGVYFKPNEKVHVYEDGLKATVFANKKGRFTVKFDSTCSGQKAGTTEKYTVKAVGAKGDSDTQGIKLTKPGKKNHRHSADAVDASLLHSGLNGTSGGSGVGGSSSGSGGLASTGVAVAGIGALGVVLLLGGGTLMVFGKRRRFTA